MKTVEYTHTGEVTVEVPAIGAAEKQYLITRQDNQIVQTAHLENGGLLSSNQSALEEQNARILVESGCDEVLPVVVESGSIAVHSFNGLAVVNPQSKATEVTTTELVSFGWASAADEETLAQLPESFTLEEFMHMVLSMEILHYPPSDSEERTTRVGLLLKDQKKPERGYLIFLADSEHSAQHRFASWSLTYGALNQIVTAIRQLRGDKLNQVFAVLEKTPEYKKIKKNGLGLQRALMELHAVAVAEVERSTVPDAPQKEEKRMSLWKKMANYWELRRFQAGADPRVNAILKALDRVRGGMADFGELDRALGGAAVDEESVVVLSEYIEAIFTRAARSKLDEEELIRDGFRRLEDLAANGRCADPINIDYRGRWVDDTSIKAIALDAASQLRVHLMNLGVAEDNVSLINRVIEDVIGERVTVDVLVAYVRAMYRVGEKVHSGYRSNKRAAEYHLEQYLEQHPQAPEYEHLTHTNYDGKHLKDRLRGDTLIREARAALAALDREVLTLGRAFKENW